MKHAHCLMIWFLAMGHAIAQEPQEEVGTTERDGRTFTIREHGMPPSGNERGFVRLLPYQGMEGWKIVGGKAVIERDGDTLHGHGSSGRNTFLMSDRVFGDFIMEGEIKINAGGNSGWQIRSHQPKPGNRDSGIRGYQIEVDSTQRRWSGGFYDELRRGWIHPFEDDQAARQAFKTDEWNHYRIECQGPHVRTWVNGIACADVIDFADLTGVIAFQVHSGKCDVRWRNLRILDMGTSTFVPMKIWKGEAGLLRQADGSIAVRGGSEPISIRSALDGGNTTIRLFYDLEGSAVVRLHPQDPEVTTVTIPLGSGSATTAPGATAGVGSEESRYPVAAEGAGTDSSKSKGRHELIIDVEQHRLTIILDGSVLHRAVLENAFIPRQLEIEIPMGSGGIKLHDSLEISRKLPDLMN
jgi:hypothetical protein